MKNLFLMIVLSLFALDITAKELTPKRTVVAGKVINRTPEDSKVISVNFNDMLSEDGLVGSKLNEKGEFHTEYKMLISQTINVSYGDKYFTMYLNPSDSIYVEIDMSKFRNNDYAGIHCFGSEAELNNQFPKFNEHLSSLYTFDIDINLSPREYIAKIKEASKRTQDSIAVYIKQNNLPPFFEEWARTDIIFNTAYSNIVSYGRNNQTDQLTVYTDPFFDIYNPDNFQTTLFQYYVSFLLYTKLDTDSNYAEYVKNEDYENALPLGLNMLSELPASLTADYMKYTLINNFADKKPDLSKLPKNLFKNPVFDTILREKGAPKSKFAETPISGIFYMDKDSTVTPLPEQDFFKHLTAKHKGKVIYLDVFSRWCGPCIMEFPHAKKLHESYHGDDVVFVNICLYSRYEQWLQAIPELEIEGENYFFDTDATSIFGFTYKVNGYPTYILIDKNGEIVTMNAPRPSEIETTSKAIDAIK